VGAVAEGCVFSNGRTVLNWTTRYASVGVYDSLSELLNIHGHEGSTQIEWLD
jgi:hypothetical protein